MKEYKNPNKSKGEHGYKNRRGLDMIAEMLGGLTGKAVKEIKKQKEKKGN